MFIITIIFLWVLLTFTYNNADQSVYLSRYNQPKLWKTNTELLFGFIMNLSHYLRLNFIGFKGLVSFVEIFLIGKTIWNYSNRPNLILSLYSIFPFVMHVSQIRNALATAIFIYFSRYLFDKDNIKFKYFKYLSKADLKYIFGILLASFIHTASLFWLILLLGKKLKTKQCIYVSIISSIFVIFILNTSFLNNIFRIFGAEARMSAYFSNAYQLSSSRHYSTMIAVLVTEATFLMIYFIFFMKNSFLSSKSDHLIVLGLNLNILILITLSIMYSFTSEMYRPVEGLLLINYILIVNIIPSKYFMKLKTKLRYFIAQFLLYFITIYNFLFYAANSYNFVSVVLPIFKYNYLFNIFL